MLRRISLCAGSGLRAISGRFLFAAALCAAAFAPLAAAQSFDATTLRQPTDLGAKWLLEAGDDPSWADPSLDDSKWMAVDPYKSLKTYFPGNRPTVVWYRLHVKVAPSQTGLGLAEHSLSSAFEVYVNGQKLIASGKFSPYVPYTYDAWLVEPIPDRDVAGGSLLIATRVYISTNDWVSAYPGFYPYNLSLGMENALNNHTWLLIIGGHAVQWFRQIATLGLGILAFALFTAQRRQREYLWIFLLGAVAVLQAPLQIYMLFHNLPAWMVFADGVFQFASVYFEILMYLAFLRMRVTPWLRFWLVLAGAGLFYNLWQAATGAGSSLAMLVSIAPIVVLIAAIVPSLLIAHARRGNREAAILLVPAIIGGLSTYLEVAVFLFGMIPDLRETSLRISKVLFESQLGPFTVSLTNIDNCAFVLALAVILVLRATHIASHQTRMEAEMAAAREVQQIVLPEKTECIPGFTVESAYEPANEVGGDFYQILPAPDGSLLVIIGDVAGKGMPAAMLVSVLVGAIRGVAEYTADPAALLASLNQRLVGRVGENYVTAMAARIFPNGAVTLANAGHLAPYLDGREVEVPGELPLGAKAGTSYETVRFELPKGSRLTFYSDGIVEAQNPARELFGFERSRQISTEPVAQIVAEAKQHGQNDDMTVIAITRDRADESEERGMAAVAPALA